jgi:hypothetical protein
VTTLLTLALLAQIADYPDDVVAGIPVNYTQALAGQYTLPPLLELANGKPIKDAKTWINQRRPELLKLHEQQQFGHAPKAPAKLKYDIFDKGTAALDGKAIRRQVTIELAPGHNMDLLLYLPADAKGPVPVLLNLSFTANSNTVEDPGIKPGEIWNAKEKKRVPATAGRAFGRLNVPPFLADGIGVATVYYGDIDPDFDGGFEHGVRAAFGQPKPEDWGTIAAWAWGLSRALDYLETDKGVNAKKVAIIGVSRLGKTVLWAGANDQRFAAVIASCSGEGGAAISRRNYGELVKHLNVRFGYQFAKNYQNHGDRPDQMPFDAHSLVALMAPRPLLLQTGNTDKWSDPRGEFEAAVAATPVYALFGKQGIDAKSVPPAGEPHLNTLGYFMHAGGHGTIPTDWAVFRDFLKKHLF